MSKIDVRSQDVAKAVTTLQRRAERVTDLGKLREIYVESGVLAELDPSTNQIIYGRRGVGKTHLINVYRDWCFEAHDNILFQIHDCQRLGSGLGSEDRPPRVIAISYFVQLLNDIATQAFDDIPRLDSADALKRPGDLGSAILSFQDIINKGGDSGSSFDFRNLGDTLDAYRSAAGSERLVIALDEFVSIPKPAQPHFAELIKRAFFTKPKISFLLAAVSYSSNTWTGTDSGNIGFEPGADTFADIDLDQHFVWEEDEDRAELFFGQVLYNHLAGDLNLDLARSGEQKRQDIVKMFFTQDRAFSDLCRAAEGNCRDLLNIFRASFAKFIKDKGSDRIGIPQVNQGAEEWFSGEKLRTIQTDGRLEEFLNHLTTNIIRGRKTKTFMVHSRDIHHPILLKLYAARLLHPLRTIWRHPDQPGDPYRLVTMDFGCYVSLRNTKSAPNEQLFFSPDDRQFDDLVPLDDRRSIRRVVVDRQTLDSFMV